MRKNNIKSVGYVLMVLFSTYTQIVYAGNENRIGQAGATELLINPWARSSGWGDANTATAVGLEAMHLNVAGTAFTQKTEILFARTNWLGSGIANINAFGFTQKAGEAGVLGLGIMSFGFGDIPVTTYDRPDGEIGTFSPQYMNLAVSYARVFSNSIYGGLAVKSIYEGIPNVKAGGVALDAGIRYVTGKKENIKFGISLRNWGPRMQFTGDGMSFKVRLDNPTRTELTLQQRNQEFELPSLLNIGFAYDFLFLPTKDSLKQDDASTMHRFTLAGNFTSNSFSKDQIRFGAEYAYKSFLMLRAGYVYEEGLLKKSTRTTAFAGPTAGITVELPLGSKGTTFALDYSYRVNHPFQGTHCIGARINIL